MTRRVRVIGVGPGDPEQVTLEAVAAMRSVAYFVVADKGPDDPLLAARQALLDRHVGAARVVAVPDPERDRSVAATGDYLGAVTDWHDARAAAYERVLLDHDGDAGFLVWGDPAFYDSTIRIVEKVLARGNAGFEWDVIPGVSSLQLLAARHRIVLHDIGRPVTVTTARRLCEAVAAGADNVLVMLSARLDLDDLRDWDIWWGANLGTPHERLVAGRVGDVLAEIHEARAAVKSAAGWLMDVYLLRGARGPLAADRSVTLT
ncbi:precorrin-6A synthase (deacetylating) [Jiangella sp. DSM 45060]|uniref:precorrin-6A synthase (deacetylating) n=1 Tax=Jiangella sp. DSM 45060 TaxID=1798224 RepID=UPI00087C1DC3|nr:precorrin-6A synthase (deacetylating) [Jiangella sp. DSM 45060]SDT45952.1 precorrin-6A synthase (deacetylating) [Jiangella sp. DSM 45060]